MEEIKTSNEKFISRGKFIKNTALAATGFYIVPRHVLGGKGFVAPVVLFEFIFYFFILPEKSSFAIY